MRIVSLILFGLGFVVLAMAIYVTTSSEVSKKSITRNLSAMLGYGSARAVEECTGAETMAPAPRTTLRTSGGRSTSADLSWLDSQSLGVEVIGGGLLHPVKDQRNRSHARFLTEEEFREREKSNIEAALEVVGWQVAGEGGAADLLGIPASTLANRMRKFGISKPVETRFDLEELRGRRRDLVAA